MIYKCRNCGGNVVYDPDRKEMHCPYCDGTDTQDKLPGGGMETCANCGAPIDAGDYRSAVKCEYCGHYTIFDERVEGLESFLLGRLQRRNEFENNRMRMVMTRLLQCRGMFNVEQLASYACLSRKQFERVFAAYVGLMPKQYLRVIRFLYAVEFRNRMPEVDLATLAFHTGYYDAAHLANEIKALTGHTSSTLFQLMCFSEDAESIEWFLGA